MTTTTRDRENAILRKLSWYKKYPTITRVWLDPSSGKRGYAGGILRTRKVGGRPGGAVQTFSVYSARTFDEQGITITAESPELHTHRDALLWLAAQNGVTA